MRPSTPGVSGIVVLRWQVVSVIRMMPLGSVMGSRKCFLMGHVMDVKVCPCAALLFPWAMHRKQDWGQSQPLPLWQSFQGQLKWWRVSWWAPLHLLQTTKSLCQWHLSTVCPSCRQRVDEAAVGMMRRLEHSQKEIVLKERGKLLAWNTVRKR